MRQALPRQPGIELPWWADCATAGRRTFDRAQGTSGHVPASPLQQGTGRDLRARSCGGHCGVPKPCRVPVRGPARHASRSSGPDLGEEHRPLHGRCSGSRPHGPVRNGQRPCSRPGRRWQEPALGQYDNPQTCLRTSRQDRRHTASAPLIKVRALFSLSNSFDKNEPVSYWVFFIHDYGAGDSSIIHQSKEISEVAGSTIFTVKFSSSVTPVTASGREVRARGVTMI